MKLKLTKTFLSSKPSQNSFLVGIIALGSLAMFFGANQESFSANGFLVYEKKEYWRAFTTTLLHADLNHLAANAFFFSGLSTLLHHYFGIWVFPVLSFLVGGLINLIALKIYPPAVHLVGVSGVVYFMASFWLTLYVLIEKRQKLMVRFMHACAVSLIFLFPQVFEAKVSYLAHGLGFIFGVPLAITYYLLFKIKIHSKDQWEEIIHYNDEEEMEKTILLEESSYRLVQPEEVLPSERASDYVQSR